MTNTDKLQEAKNRLLVIKKETEDAMNDRHDTEKTVELDQTRTGRLTRMDALQSQSMAKAVQQRSVMYLQRINAALARIESGDYGDCVCCDEEIGSGRLAADPAILICIDCANKKENIQR